jgi:hypothetical protein
MNNTPNVITAVNIALLLSACAAAIVMIASFRKDTLQKRSQQLFFAKILATGVGAACYAVSFIHSPVPRDALNIIELSFAYIGIYVVYFLYVMYIKAVIEELDKNDSVPLYVTYLALILCVTGSLFRIISIFDHDFISLGEEAGKAVMTANLGQFCGALLMLMTFIMLIRHRKTIGRRHTIVLSSMPILMALATIIEQFSNGIKLIYPALIIEFLIVYTQHHLDIETRIQRDEISDTRARLDMATGRMKPHYLYNVLTTIYYLCETDVEKAQYAIGVFSEYLRSTLEVMDKQELVEFSWELNEIRNYLTLERLRFGDKLDVDFDIEYEDFKVPPLSIQALVENAVKHGLGQKEEGGKLRIVSRRLSDGGAQIRIRDDGVGFDVEELATQDIAHGGIVSIRERLRIEIGAEMTVTSTPGKGTTVMVTIRPQDGI